MRERAHNVKAFITGLNKEVWIWAAALIVLALSDPDLHHFTLCPLANMGWDWCPGCGLGRSVSLLFMGRWFESLTMHPLGAVTVILLLFRMYSLIRLQYLFNEKTNAL